MPSTKQPTSTEPRGLVPPLSKASSEVDRASVGTRHSNTTFGGGQPGPIKKIVLVAKEINKVLQPDETTQGKTVIPLSILANEQHLAGPKYTKDGKIISHSILGDLADYEEIAAALDGPNATKKAVEQKKEFNQMKEGQRSLLERKRLIQALRANEKREHKKWMDKLHIFQKFREIREEHALKNWKRHLLLWAETENTVSRHIARHPSELVSARLGDFRKKREEQDLIREAVNLIEYKRVDFWREGLRMGNALFGLHMNPPKGGPREFERLRGPNDVTERQGKRVSVHPHRFEHHRRAELSKVLDVLDPFHNREDPGFLAVVGENILNSNLENFATDFVEHMQEQTKEETELEISMRQKSLEASMAHHPRLGMSLTLSSKRLFFEVDVGNASRSNITLYNEGTVACTFEWRRVAPVNSLKVTKTYDGVERFFIGHQKGMILPGSAFDFPILFKSDNAGVFKETWSLVTSPTYLDLHVEFQGMVIQPDRTASKRAEVERLLTHRQAIVNANYAVELVLETVMRHILKPVIKNQAQIDENVFYMANQGYDFIYNATIFESFRALATQAFADAGRASLNWNGSVMQISDVICTLTDPAVKATHLESLNDLVRRASTPLLPSKVSMKFTLVYDMLSESVNKIARASEGIRVRMGLPLWRAATRKFLDGDEASATSRGASAAQRWGQEETAPSVSESKSSNLKALDARKISSPPANLKTSAPGVTAENKKGSNTASSSSSAPSTSSPLAKNSVKAPGGKDGANTSSSSAGNPSKKTSDATGATGGAVGDDSLPGSSTSPSSLTDLDASLKNNIPPELWDAERKESERVYLAELKEKASLVISSAADRLVELLRDV